MARAKFTSTSLVARLRKLGLGLIVPAILLGWWEIAAGAGAINTFFFPAPSHIVVNGVTHLLDGSLTADISATLLRVFSGIAIGGSTGYLAGLFTGTSALIRALFEPFFSAFYTIPKIAILPVFIFLFGLGESPVIAIISITVFFYVWVYTFGAVRGIDSSYLDVARTYSASRWAILRHVIIPATLPQVFTGLRVAVAVGTLITITTEIVIGDSGLGFVIFHSRMIMRIEDSYVGIFAVSILGFTLQRLVVRIGRWATPWVNAESNVPTREFR